MIVGRHISFMGSIATATEMGCKVIQIFLGSPQMIKNKKKPTKELNDYGTSLFENKIKMVVHSSYTINLAHPLKTTRSSQSIDSLIQDVRSVFEISHGGKYINNCLGVIIHMGKNMPINNLTRSQALKCYADSIKHVINKTELVKIIIETGAGQGNEVGSTLEEMKIINDLINHDRVMFCIDSCHIWSCGYDISSKKGVDDYFNKFDDYIGINRIACIHLNDSQKELGCRVDRHDNIGHGQIGLGIKHFIKKVAHIPIILETPVPETNTVEFCKEEIKKVCGYLVDNLHE